MIPAAGSARRLGLGRRSKEVLPVRWRVREGRLRPWTALDRLLESWGRAGVSEAWIGLRCGKWDVAEHLVDPEDPDRPRLVWRILGETPSVSATVVEILRGRPTSPAPVLLGFPDILYRPLDAARALVEDRSGADVLLAGVPGDRPLKSDMFDVDGAGRIVRYEIKSEAGCACSWTWVLARWGRRFQELLAARVREAARRGDLREMHVGDVVRTALEQGMDVRARTFPDGSSLDLGTPDDFLRAPTWLVEELVEEGA